MVQEPLFPELPDCAPTQAPVPIVPTRPGQARLYKPVRNQVEMMMRDLDSLLPEDHLARAVWAFVERLDLSAFYVPIKAIEGEPGRPATDPQALVALWVYAIADGVGKARHLDRLCHEHDAYRWLRGGVPINYHMLADFRVEHGPALDDLLTRILAAMAAGGLVDLGRVCQDGVRVRASAGAASFRREARLKQFLAQAQAQVSRLAGELAAELEGDAVAIEGPSRRQEAARLRAARERQERVERALAELPAVQGAKKTEEERQQARASVTDPEARVMKMPDGGFRPAYNVQLASQLNNQVIVGVSVTNRGTDGAEAPPMLEQVKERNGATPSDYLIDGGEATLRTIEELSRGGVNVYAPTKPPRGNKRDQAEPRPTDTLAVADWRVRMGTEEGKAIYRERGMGECVNARMRQHGLYQFVVRGLPKVTCVVLWMVIAHNLLRWMALTS